MTINATNHERKYLTVCCRPSKCSPQMTPGKSSTQSNRPPLANWNGAIHEPGQILNPVRNFGRVTFSSSVKAARGAGRAPLVLDLPPSHFNFVVVGSSTFIVDSNDRGVAIPAGRLLNDTDLSTPFSFAHKYLGVCSG
jgi:hypothetical protein